MKIKLDVVFIALLFYFLMCLWGLVLVIILYFFNDKLTANLSFLLEKITWAGGIIMVTLFYLAGYINKKETKKLGEDK